MLRSDIIKLLEENISSWLFDIGLSNIFWISPKATEIKANINKMEYIKLEIFAQWRKLSMK